MNKPPDAVVFFLDRNLGTKMFPSILRSSRIRCEVHADHFSQGEEDRIWIPAVASRGWFILTYDERIGYNTAEQESVRRSKAGMFVLIGGHTSAEALAQNFVTTLPRILTFISKHTPPFIAKISRPSSKDVARGKSGKVVLWKKW